MKYMEFENDRKNDFSILRDDLYMPVCGIGYIFILFY